MLMSDWIMLATIALPLVVKAAADVQATLIARRQTAMANIVGMAGRLVAGNARALLAMPEGALNARGVERELVASSVQQLTAEMGKSIAIKGASVDHLTAIVQGELDKLIVAKPAAKAPVL